jgi:phthalate 4,5-dioxygenase oxygenase subunit
MVTWAENELMTRVEGAAPLGGLIRQNYWVPFGLSDNLTVKDGPTPVRLFGKNYVAFRDVEGRLGLLDELCPHRRSSLLLARHEGDGIRCIYHGWKMSATGEVVECPTQAVRPERFAANVGLAHYPVHEEGGIAWVWLGGGATPPFPDLPFSERHGVRTEIAFARVPCNWLQGLEGGLDSVHAPILHKSVIEETIKKMSGTTGVQGVRTTIDASPRYETEPAPYGLRACSLRDVGNARTFVRVAHYFFPLVIVVPNGYDGLTHLFAFAPVDDTQHLLFFGNYGESPMSQREVAGVRDGYEPDPHNMVSLSGGRWNRWGQDRAAMNNGHWSGFTNSALDEDTVVQVSMGPITDRPRENLSSSDVAIAEGRRLILDTIAAVAGGALPPGGARGPDLVRIPHPFEAVLDEGTSWSDLDRVPS